MECLDTQKLTLDGCTHAYETVIRENPEIPSAPKYFGNFDFTALGGKARKLRFADDKWVSNGNHLANEIYGADILPNRQLSVQKWLGVTKSRFRCECDLCP